MVPLGYPWAFPGPPGISRRPPGPKTNQSKKPKNLKDLTEQWSLIEVKYAPEHFPGHPRRTSAGFRSPAGGGGGDVYNEVSVHKNDP